MQRIRRSDIRWAPVIPLIGGHPLGAERAIGTPPVAVYSYDGFLANDSHYVHYQNEILGRDIGYVNLGTAESVPELDLAVMTCPCAALSQLNSSSDATRCGAGGVQNEWMYVSALDAMTKLNAKVIIGENAPGLYTKKGEPVATRLNNMALEHGYAFSMYKTSTHFHGIPQRRDRTFYMLWKSDKSPILNWHTEEYPVLSEYLSTVGPDALHQDLVINPNLMLDPYSLFIKHHLGVTDIRDALISSGNRSTLWYVVNGGLLPDARDFFTGTGNARGLKLATHALDKFAAGTGVWDGTMQVYGDRMNALIGRNMYTMLHPTADRSLTIRESLHMMAFPDNFELLNGKQASNHIAQNVPVTTAAYMVSEIVEVLAGNREFANSRYIKQNNWKQTNEVMDTGSIRSVQQW